MKSEKTSSIFTSVRCPILIIFQVQERDRLIEPIARQSVPHSLSESGADEKVSAFIRAELKVHIVTSDVTDVVLIRSWQLGDNLSAWDAETYTSNLLGEQMAHKDDN